MIYIGSFDGRLYALDARTGQEKWSFKTDGEVYSSPAVAGGVVYFSSTDGYLYAVR
jgi:outer membrane protein assembly factor BamB